MYHAVCRTRKYRKRSEIIIQVKHPHLHAVAIVLTTNSEAIDAILLYFNNYYSNSYKGWLFKFNIAVYISCNLKAPHNLLSMAQV